MGPLKVGFPSPLGDNPGRPVIRARTLATQAPATLALDHLQVLLMHLFALLIVIVDYYRSQPLLCSAWNNNKNFKI